MREYTSGQMNWVTWCSLSMLSSRFWSNDLGKKEYIGQECVRWISLSACDLISQADSPENISIYSVAYLTNLSRIPSEKWGSD